MRVIYDVGAHLGEEIEYYLLKADKVVSIEANPYAIERLRENFHQQLSSGRLKLIHSAISSFSGETSFHVNHKESVLSRRNLVESEIARFGDKCSDDAWERVTVPAAKLSDVIRDHGDPYFIKIDLEGDEELAIQDLYSQGIRPPYISTEIPFGFSGCLCYMYLLGYRSFQLVNMNTVEHQFSQYPITPIGGEQTRYNFERGSSGPFGEDLPSWWVDFERLGFLIATRTLIFGDDPWHWYDVHARLH